MSHTFLRRAALPATLAAISFTLWPTTETSSAVPASANLRFQNWSRTTETTAKKVYQPTTYDQVQSVLAEASSVRVVGSGLSPNGSGIHDGTLLSVEELDQVVSVDLERQQVTVQAGMQVGALVDHLKPHGLTLQNLASINQQQVGGIIQVGAHGTGAFIPPIDDHVVAMKLATPSMGILHLSKESHPELFSLAKCGLGALGVVCEVTFQCTKAHRLEETTVVLKRDDIKDGHVQRLRENRHVRYMWIPYTDSVVVVTSNVVEGETDNVLETESQDCNLHPLRKLAERTEPQFSTMSFADLRQAALERTPGTMLDVQAVKAINEAELEFWKSIDGCKQVADSDEVLAFDCGGEQLVLEVAIPCGSITADDLSYSGKDIDFVLQLLDELESSESVAGPAPIEQRWTCASTSQLSPVRAVDPARATNELHSWIGIINYLPTKDGTPDNSRTRENVSNMFDKYVALTLGVADRQEVQCNVHWAKISQDLLGKLNDKIRATFPVDDLVRWKNKCDNRNVMSSFVVDEWIK